MTMQKAVLTVTLDEETVQWARREAARRNRTVSEFLGEVLRQRMEREVGYEDAMHRWTSGPTRPLSRRSTPLSREALHERRDPT